MKWPIRKKLLLAFGSVIALTVIVGVVAWDRVNALGKLAIEVATHDELALAAREMEVTNAEANIADHAFRLTEAAESGAFARSAREFFSAADRAGRALRRLTSTVADANYSENLEGARGAMREYQAAFATLQREIDARGHADDEDEGEIGVMRRDARALEQAAGELDDLRVMVSSLTLRRHEKDFLLRNETTYVEQFRAEMTSLRGLAPSVAGEERARADLVRTAGAYSASFERVARRTLRIRDLTAALDAKNAAVDPFVHALIAASQRDVREHHGEIGGVINTGMTLITIVVVFAGLLGLGIAWFISGQISGSTAALVEGTRRVAAGDLTTPVQVRSEDELGQLASAYNAMAESLAGMIRRLKNASEALGGVTAELSAAATQQSSGVEEQATSVEETMATSEEIARTAAQVSDAARQVSEGADASVSSSMQGRQALDRAVEGMGSIREQVESIAVNILDLSEKTQQIGAIIATVNDISEQSNILALNAAIEAARAGEQGNAFSVVAGEVRSLAEQSRRATEQVRTILSEIQQATNKAVMVTEEGSKRVERGIDLVETAGQVIGELAEVIAKSAANAKQIAAATDQQAAGLRQISAAMAGLNESSGQLVSAIKETEMSSQNLVSMSHELGGEVAKYRLASV